MKPIDIRIALLQNGYSNTRLAQELRLARSTVGEVIHGRQSSRRVATRISVLTGLPIATLWPGRYSESRKAA